MDGLTTALIAVRRERERVEYHETANKGKRLETRMRRLTALMRLEQEFFAALTNVTAAYKVERRLIQEAELRNANDATKIAQQHNNA